MLKVAITLLMCFEIFKFVSADGFEKDGNYAVLLGGNIKISCFPKTLNPNTEIVIGSSYLWMDETGKEILDARFIKLGSGDLMIKNAHVGDSGNYTCKVISPVPRTKNGTNQSHPHRLIVYEISGHQFTSQLYFDMTNQNVELTLALLRDLIATICRRELCDAGPIKVLQCKLEQSQTKLCEFSITYEGINKAISRKCNENCIQAIMMQKLAKVEKLLEHELLQLAETPNSRLKADMRSLNTRHIITCTAGFHLVQRHYKRCFPCPPGTFSEANSDTCHMCGTGSYQEHYAKGSCEDCEEGKTTDTVGAVNRAECVEKDTGFLSDIKEGIVSIFTG